MCIFAFLDIINFLPFGLSLFLYLSLPTYLPLSPSLSTSPSCPTHEMKQNLLNTHECDIHGNSVLVCVIRLR